MNRLALPLPDRPKRGQRAQPLVDEVPRAAQVVDRQVEERGRVFPLNRLSSFGFVALALAFVCVQ